MEDGQAELHADHPVLRILPSDTRNTPTLDKDG